ncbi:MAG: dethiobiotin synthase [Nitrospirota bacterium]
MIYMRNKGIFITATDTGVGKTVVTAALVFALKKSGYSVGVMKPVETGSLAKNSKLVPYDALFLLKAAGIKEDINIIVPYVFKHPLAPAIAADIEGVKVSFSHILDCYRKLSQRYDIVLVEGAGGILVPVCKGLFFTDLIKKMNIPVIVVARPILGTINHSLLTIKYAKNEGIKVLGFVLNYTEKIKSGMAEKTNPSVIQTLSKVPLLGILPYINGIDVKKGRESDLEDISISSLNIDRVRRYIES